MDDHNKSCKERIISNYRSRMSDIYVALGMRKPDKYQKDELTGYESSTDWYLESLLSLGDFDNHRGAPIPRWFDKHGYEWAQEQEQPFHHRIVNVELSWGGPGDGFVLFCDGNTIHDVYYYFQDWFDGATHKVTGRAFDAIKQMFDELIYKDEYRVSRRESWEW